MAASKVKKQVLCVYEILLNETDEQHMLNGKEIVGRLFEKYGIQAERRSVYVDIDTLIEFGVDIIKQKGSNPGVYVGSRRFELPELKILLDAIQVSRFLTRKKSDQLIEKLTNETSIYEAEELQSQLILASRPKAENERILYNVDTIHRAIYLKKQVKFRYAEWTIHKEYHFRKNGAFYLVSPIALIWDDERYYLAAYDPEKSMTRHYRVDKIMDVSITDQPLHDVPEVVQFDAPKFCKKTFGMFGGEDRVAELTGENSAIGILLDQFGVDLPIEQTDDEHFLVRTPVTVSEPFFGWLTMVGKRIRLTGPEDVVQKYREHLSHLLNNIDRTVSGQ